MSIFWDSRARKPQIWVYFVFIGLPILIFVAIYNYGMMRSKCVDTQPEKSVEDFK